MKDTYYIFGSIFFIAQQWQNIADRELGRRSGLTTKQWMLLVVLSRVFTDRLPTLSETARSLGTSRQNIKRLASDLQKKGFIVIVQDPHDRRIQRLALTGKHGEVFEGEDNLEWQEDFVRSLFTGLDGPEQAKLSKLLYRLLKRIEHLEGMSS